MISSRLSQSVKHIARLQQLCCSNSAHNIVYKNPSFQPTRRTLFTTFKQWSPLPKNVKDEVHVSEFHCLMGRSPPLIDETSSPFSIQIEFVNIRLEAQVNLPAIPEGDTWQVGFIQGCDTCNCTMEYGEYGQARWDILELNSGLKKMVSDSLNHQAIPWYSNVVVSKGPVSGETVSVSMTDVPSMNVSWDAPVKAHAPSGRFPRLQAALDRVLHRGSYSLDYSEAKLTAVRRQQRFYTWLVLNCVETECIIKAHYHVLKTVRWEIDEVVDIDCSKPCGERAHCWVDETARRYVVLDENIEIPKDLFEPPCLNLTQALVWYPFKGHRTPFIVVPSQTDQDNHTRDHGYMM